jgi:3-deoxy-D-manno-octulosonic-acid transferase
MQTEVDRERIESLGASREKVRVFGNLKYDVLSGLQPLESNLTQVLRASQPLWIAASTTATGTANPANEEEQVIAAFAILRQNHPELKLLIAPRHPERFVAVEQMVLARGFQCVRRTASNGSHSGTTAPSFTDVLLLDTIGELASTFSFASVVFMGGTLVPRGGHNILEPAALEPSCLEHMKTFVKSHRYFSMPMQFGGMLMNWHLLADAHGCRSRSHSGCKCPPN